MFGYRRELLQKVDVYKKIGYSFRNILDGSLCSSWCREATNTTPSLLLWHAEFLNQREPEGLGYVSPAFPCSPFPRTEEKLSDNPLSPKMLPTKKRETAFSPFPGTSLVKDVLKSYHRRAGFITSYHVFSICSTSWKNRLQTVVFLGPHSALWRSHTTPTELPPFPHLSLLWRRNVSSWVWLSYHEASFLPWALFKFLF